MEEEKVKNREKVLLLGVNQVKVVKLVDLIIK